MACCTTALVCKLLLVLCSICCFVGFAVIIYNNTDANCFTVHTISTLALTGGIFTVVINCGFSLVYCTVWVFGILLMFAFVELILLIFINVKLVECYAPQTLEAINVGGGLLLLVGVLSSVAVKTCYRTTSSAYESTV